MLVYAAAAMSMLMAQDADGGAAAEPAQPAVCQAQQDELNGISAKYEPETQQLTEDGEKIEGHHVSGEIKFKLRTFSADLPSVTMKAQRMVFGVPEVTMRDRKFAWDNPTVVMKTVKIGEKPEVTCKWKNGIPKCTTRWRPIYADLPTTEMRRKEIITAVPETRMAKRELVTNIPQFKMRRQEWSAKLPEITVDNPIPSRDPPPEAKELEQRANALGERINGDVAASTDRLFDCLSADLVARRKDVALQFEVAINQQTAAITTIAASGADPSSVERDGARVNLYAERDSLMKERDDALADLDKALEKMAKREKAIVEQAVT